MRDADKFKTWLTGRGAILEGPTNEWELIRFRTSNGVSVIYTNKKGDLTFTGESQKAYDNYRQNKTWSPENRKRKNLRAKKATLAARDGKRCFADLRKLSFDDLTIEHLLSVSHGGTDSLNNLCLLCEECNRAVGNLPLTQKIEYIVEQRTAVLAQQMTAEAAFWHDHEIADIELHHKVEHTKTTGKNFFKQMFDKDKK